MVQLAPTESREWRQEVHREVPASVGQPSVVHPLAGRAFDLVASLALAAAGLVDPLVRQVALSCLPVASAAYQAEARVVAVEGLVVDPAVDWVLAAKDSASALESVQLAFPGLRGPEWRSDYRTWGTLPASP